MYPASCIVSEDSLTAFRDFSNDQETLDWLLDQGVDANRTDTRRTDDGQSLYIGGSDSSLKVLNNIAASGNIQLFDHIVARGADPSHSLALHCASKCDDAQKTIIMISHLVSHHGMDIDADTDTLRDFFHDAEDSGTPICSAIHYKNLAAVQELIRKGASVQKCGKSGYISVSKAIGGPEDPGIPAILRALLEAGADALLGLKSAVHCHNVEAAKICLEYGANPATVWNEARQQQKVASEFVRNAFKEGLDDYVEEHQVAEAQSFAILDLLEKALEHAKDFPARLCSSRPLPEMNSPTAKGIQEDEGLVPN